MSQVESQLEEERELRKWLNLNRSWWEAKIGKLKNESSEYEKLKKSQLEELKEQARDLTFFVEAQKQIERSEHKADIEGGQIIMEKSDNRDNAISAGHEPRKGRKAKR